jgi:hypothetical protein
MYTLSFKYAGDHHQEYAHIAKVEYNTSSGPVSLSGKDILSQDYPLNIDLHLFAELKSYKIPHNCLKSIEVTKEKS